MANSIITVITVCYDNSCDNDDNLLSLPIDVTKLDPAINLVVNDNIVVRGSVFLGNQEDTLVNISR